MKRVLILGPGASGKSTLAARLAEITGLPVIELDKIFWKPGLLPLPRDQWVELQQKLVDEDQWIIDGDLGIRCAWRALRRSRERSDFWLWLWRYRRRSRPILIEAINKLAPQADLHLLRNPKALKQFLAHIVRTS